LTRIIRDKGAQAGCIVTGAKASAEEAVRAARKFPGLKGMDLAKLVSTKQAYQWNQGSIWPERQSVYTKRVASFHVVAFDYGIKRNILRLIADQDCRLTVVPATAKAEEVQALLPDGVFLSNGPGDPEPCDYAIEAIRTLVDTGIPVFGICLGHQLPAAAVKEMSWSPEQSPSGRDRLRAGHDHESEPWFRRARADPAGQCSCDAPVPVRRQLAGYRATDRGVLVPGHQRQVPDRTTFGRSSISRRQ
jgi:hypothetical protein